MNNTINLINMSIDTNLDADDLGQRLVECARAASTDTDVVNFIKIHMGQGSTPTQVSNIIYKSIIEPLKSMNVANCVFIPLIPGYIEDVTVDCIEVVRHDPNSITD